MEKITMILKKVIIIGFSTLIVACASESYTKDINSKSRREEYVMPTIEQPVTIQDQDVPSEYSTAMVFPEHPDFPESPRPKNMAYGVKNIANTTSSNDTWSPPYAASPQTATSAKTVVSNPSAIPNKKVISNQTVVSNKNVISNQAAMAFNSGYTIQVVAVSSKNKVAPIANQLFNRNQPVWENYKKVNGAQWYTVLYGDFTSRADAMAEIKRLPKSIQNMKPFVKSMDSIRTSEFPTINRLD